jgi:hypothetical protein
LAAMLMACGVRVDRVTCRRRRGGAASPNDTTLLMEAVMMEHWFRTGVLATALLTISLFPGCCKHAEQSLRCQLAKEGYVALFNGKDLTGWEATGNARWFVEDGCLVGTQGENNAPGDLFTKQSYNDFELVAFYRAEWPCNSGIWFRFQNDNKAYQADILEYKNPEAYSGTLYCPGKLFLARNLNKELEDRDGFNTIRIRTQGTKTQIWFNGVQTADVDDNTTDSGKIGLQVHPGAEFGPMKIVIRDIMIKEL